jgi:hypothetical protein
VVLSNRLEAWSQVRCAIQCLQPNSLLNAAELEPASESREAVLSGFGRRVLRDGGGDALAATM